MSWQGYIDSLMKNESMADASIWGYGSGQVSCWASYSNGWFSEIKEAEIKQILAPDHSSLLSNGMTLAGNKCTLLRDNIHTDGQNTMDLKMKISPTNPDPYPITIGKSNQCLIFGRGVKDAHGGKVNPPIHDMTAYLKSMNY